MKLKFIVLGSLALSLSFFTSCEKDEDTDDNGTTTSSTTSGSTTSSTTSSTTASTTSGSTTSSTTSSSTSSTTSGSTTASTTSSTTSSTTGSTSSASMGTFIVNDTTYTTVIGLSLGSTDSTGLYTWSDPINNNLQIYSFGQLTTGTYNVVGYFSNLLTAIKTPGSVSIVNVMPSSIQWWSLNGGTCEIVNEGGVVSFKYTNIIFAKGADESIKMKGSGYVKFPN